MSSSAVATQTPKAAAVETAEAPETTSVADTADEIQGLPNWYFPIMGCFAGIFDIARAHPVLYWGIPVVAALNLILSLTVLRTRMRYMKSLWRNKRTRLLAVTLLAVRFAVRLALVGAGLEMGEATGGLILGVLMAVLGTAMAWGNQRLILRALRRASAA
ncbi:hypothetical protein ACWCP6_29910 [Streptomyces sp. NPDC002004]